MASSTVTARAQTIWCMRLQSAVRTALACAVVGCATVYGPKFLVDEIKFAAFSYLTAVLIVSDASLGDALKGGWHALCATAQVVPLAMLGRCVVDRLPVGMAAVSVAVAAFAVALPKCTHLTAKRIAFGQIVLVCSDAVLDGGTRAQAAGYMHPVYVAASTALGASASVLALLVPFPGLASYKVQKLCGVFAENASQMMNIYLKSFTANNNRTKMELISEAKPLAETGAKLSQSIKTLMEGMYCERPWSRYLKTNILEQESRLQNMELQMRGIEYALLSSPAFPVQQVDQEQLSNIIKGISIQIKQKIKQVRHFSHFHSKTEPETRGEFKEKTSLPLEHNFSTLKQGWVFFYFSCIGMLLNDASDAHVFQSQQGKNKTEFNIMKTFKAWILELTSKGRLEFAFKCSFSLSLAMLFGLIFDKENGCWAGLTIAISFVTGRQAIFTIANTRAQGTAIGTAYGVICCSLFHQEKLRLLALLPWVVFTSFLRNSIMYGQTGGVSAAIGALLILGRKNYGYPNEFAIARLTEVFIGLSAFILVELFLQPIRAATLAKNHMCLTLCSIRDSVKGIGIYMDQKNKTVENFLELREKLRNLDYLMCELKKFVADAELEPDFWYLPFRSSCYQKLIRSLSNTVDMLHFTAYNLRTIPEPSETRGVCKELNEQIKSKLYTFQETLSSSQVYLEKALLTESQSESESEERMDEKTSDLELGKLHIQENFGAFITEHEALEETTEEEDSEGNKRLRESIIQSLGATGFCINSLMREIENTAICIKEIDRWDNPSRGVQEKDIEKKLFFCFF